MRPLFLVIILLVGLASSQQQNEDATNDWLRWLGRSDKRPDSQYTDVGEASDMEQSEERETLGFDTGNPNAGSRPWQFNGQNQQGFGQILDIFEGIAGVIEGQKNEFANGYGYGDSADTQGPLFNFFGPWFGNLGNSRSPSESGGRQFGGVGDFDSAARRPSGRPPRDFQGMRRPVSNIGFMDDNSGSAGFPSGSSPGNFGGIGGRPGNFQGQRGPQNNFEVMRGNTGNMHDFGRSSEGPQGMRGPQSNFGGFGEASGNAGGFRDPFGNFMNTGGSPGNNQGLRGPQGNFGRPEQFSENFGGSREPTSSNFRGAGRPPAPFRGGEGERPQAAQGIDRTQDIPTGHGRPPRRPQGRQEPQAAQKPQGLQGTQGPQAIQGPQESQGPQANQEPQELPGTQGSPMGYPGTQEPPQGLKEPEGSSALNTSIGLQPGRESQESSGANAVRLDESAQPENPKEEPLNENSLNSL